MKRGLSVVLRGKRMKSVVCGVEGKENEERVVCGVEGKENEECCLWC